MSERSYISLQEIATSEAPPRNVPQTCPCSTRGWGGWRWWDSAAPRRVPWPRCPGFAPPRRASPAPAAPPSGPCPPPSHRHRRSNLKNTHRERDVLFNDALNTFYLTMHSTHFIYGYMEGRREREILSTVIWCQTYD